MLRVWQKLDRYASKDPEGRVLRSRIYGEYDLRENVSLWSKPVEVRAVPGLE